MTSELLIFFGILFAALSAIDRTQSDLWNNRDKKIVLGNGTSKEKL
jgi:hypothetical protein